MNKRKKVILIFGGPSSEHEVSISSALSILENYNKEKIKMIPLFLSKKKEWVFKEDALDLVLKKKKVVKKISFFNIFPILKKEKIDLIFPIIHGEFGEDGKLQTFLKELEIPFLFSNPLTSALAMDKFKTKKFLESFKIKSPNSILLKKSKQVEEIKKLNFPIILKPVKGGSSMGIFLIKNKSELDKNFLNNILKKETEYLIEEFIQGREFSVSLMGNNKKVKVLAITEIIPKLGEFYDYNSKYQEGGSKHICPAKISQKIEKELKKISLKIYSLMECQDLARVDFLVDKKGKIFFIEVNTIPGMTKTSLIPEAAKSQKISFKKFLDKLICNHKKTYTIS